MLTLSRSGDDVLTLFGTLPFGAIATRLTWEIKVAGLAVVFVYAFFKFFQPSVSKEYGREGHLL